MVTNFAASTPTALDLYAQVSGSGGADVLLLHGLFGSGSNLGAVARALADAGYRVHQPDLPNHGRSPWINTMTLQSLAQAVVRYLNTQAHAPALLLGHSLGGKVAMQMALTAPGRVAALVVADIAPVTYRASHDAVFAAIAAVQHAAPASRREAAALLREHLREEGVVQFLSLSLHRDGEGAWRWRFNADGLRAAYDDLLAAPEASTAYTGPTLFIHGALSSYVDADGKRAASRLFPAARFVEVSGTGHWLHAEQPQVFNDHVLSFFAGEAGGASGVLQP
jgi:esterase